MACKNHYLTSFIVAVLLFLLIFKPINISNMSNREISINDNKDLYKSIFTYGDVKINYNTDPTNMSYYRINLSNDEIDIPDSSVLTNKDLYGYGYKYIDEYSDQNDNRYNYIYGEANPYIKKYVNPINDVAYNRYTVVPESYFD